MSRKLTYVEIDVDYCLNAYGVAKCTAFTPGDLNPAGGNWNFQDSIRSFLPTNCTFVAGADAATYTATGADPILRTPAALTIDGSVDFIIEMDIERTVAGADDGTVYYSTSGGGAHGESGSFRKTFSLPALGVRSIVSLDMSALTAGGTDWVTHTVTQIRFDLNSGAAGAFKIYSIRVGHYATDDEATGPRKCYNTLRTCQDISNFSTSTETFRFAVPSTYLPKEIYAIPNIESIDFVPATVSLGDGLGQRATLTIMFSDHPHSDVGFNKDPYLGERGWDAYQRGTFWGKFRARYPYVQGRALRVYRGELGDELADMEVRHYVMESYDGPNADNSFRIIAKDILKLADDKRAVAPAHSQGYLVADITEADTGCTLVPSGVGAEYPDIGLANLGGNEVVRFIRMRSTQEASCILALHFEGADAATTITDSSTYALTITRNGNAQIDTEFFRIGTSAMLLDGTDDWIRLNGEAAFAFGTGDFTISFWARFGSGGIGANRTIYDSRPAATNGNYLRIWYDAASFKFKVNINSVDVLISNVSVNISIFPTTRWFNIVVMRASGQLYMYLDGVLEDDAAAATSLLNGAQRPTIGTSGNTLTAEEWIGSIDEFVIFNEAIFDPDEYDTPLGIAFPDTANRDSFSIERGLYGTVAVDHNSDDKFQICLRYSSMTPAEIINDLFLDYASIPSEYIPLTNWETEVDTYLQRNFGAVIAEPTGVAKLVGELIEQAGLYMWWDDLEQKIRLRVMRPIAPEAQLLDENLFIEQSISAIEQFDKRATQVWTYYGQINPTESVEEPNNYRSTTVTVDLQEESNFGSPAIRRVFARWIPQFGRSTALRLNDLMLGRFKFPPRRFNFSTFGDASRDVIFLGDGYNAEFRTFQDDTGSRDTVPVIITRLNPRQDLFVVEAEEATFAPFDAAALLNRVITIDTDTFDFNLREVHDSIFPEITTVGDITLRCIIETGVVVGSEVDEASITSGGRYTNSRVAFDVGDWPVGLPITIEIRGAIRGVGGRGGNVQASFIFTIYNPGQNGGIGLYTRYPVIIECADSTPVIAGGGGGGAGNTGGGGGGAGAEGGTGGTYSYSGTLDPAKYGVAGTLTLGGDGGTGATPDGGNPGLAGGDSSVLGGLGGPAIDGVSYVTYSVATPTIAGSTIN